MVGFEEAKQTVFIHGSGTWSGLEDAKNQTVCIHVVNGRSQVDIFHPFSGIGGNETVSIHPSIHPRAGLAWPSLACHTQQR
jgi:hypothetical protein